MTEQKYIVALDQGTTSSRAVVLDHDANIVSVSQRRIYPNLPRSRVGGARSVRDLCNPKLNIS